MTQHLTQEQILEALATLRKDPTLETLARATEHVVHDLQVHQAELESQNRELRETQQALEASRARYADLFDFAPIGYVTFDRVGVVLEANLTAAALLGVERSRLVGKPFTAVVSLADAHAFRDHLTCLYSDAPHAVCDAVVHSKARSALTLELTSSRSFDTMGKALDQCRTTIVDVTKKRRDAAMLQLLSEAGELLASSLDYTTTIASVAKLVVPLLADACFVDVLDENGRMRRLQIVSDDPTQQALVTLLERPLLRARTDTPQARAMEHVEPQVLAGQEAMSALPAELLEACGLPSSAVVLPLVVRDTVRGALTLVMLRSGRVHEPEDLRYAHALARRFANAIDNANLYREAQRAIRAREEILSTVSHDLRNSLSSIVMSTTLMLSSSPAQERRRDHRRIETLQRSAERMQRMTEDLIDLCAIESGQLAIDVHACNADDILGEAQASLTALAREREQHLEVRPLGKETLVACDQDRMLQILSNLVGNAVKYTPNGGHITMGAERFDAVVRFYVRDNGAGMEGEELEHLFDRYWRAEHRKKTSKGLGIGLDICKGLVESQGGAIWVESKVGRGTTFYFTLPYAEAERVELEPRDRELTVLVVDDSDQMRNVLDDSLTERGCKVLQASDGVEALELLQSEVPVDLILVDLEMPRLDGRGLVAQLVASQDVRHVPIVFMSCGRMSESEAHVLGADGFLHKPFDVASLLALVPKRDPRRATS